MTREAEVAFNLMGKVYDDHVFVEQLMRSYNYWRNVAMGGLDKFECSLA